MTSVYQASVDSYCWNTNYDIDGVFTGFFIYMPVVMWFGLGGFALYSKDLYVQILSSSYWLTSLLSTLIQVLFMEPHPNPSCVAGLGWPNWEAQLLGSMTTMMVCHRLLWRIPLSISTAVQLANSILVIPLVLISSGNATLGQTLWGFAVGAATGLFVFYVIFFFWLDRLRMLSESMVFKNWLGYRSAVSEFYAKRKHRNCPEAEAAILLSKFLSGGSSGSWKQKLWTTDDLIMLLERLMRSGKEHLLGSGNDDVEGQKPSTPEDDAELHARIHGMLSLFG